MPGIEAGLHPRIQPIRLRSKHQLRINKLQVVGWILGPIVLLVPYLIVVNYKFLKNEVWQGPSGSNQKGMSAGVTLS